jgi:hypothetical protein
MDSMWWDLESCARQLPYHRILVANSYRFKYTWCGTNPKPAGRYCTVYCTLYIGADRR